MKGKHVVLISSGQPSVNPRLVKEADALSGAGYKVTVIYQYWNAWATELDKKLLSSRNWKAIRVGGDPINQKTLYFFSRLLHKAAKTLYCKGFKLPFLPELSISRTTSFLLAEAKRHKANLYIGHNLGALPAAVLAAEYHNALCGFDAEDFHRYETSDDDNDPDVINKRFLEEKYYPRLNYLSTAAPLIAKEYAKLFPNIKISSILNVFPKTISNMAKRHEADCLKLFWFSQTIGMGRGLENIIEAIGLINQQQTIELHLLGNSTDQTIEEFGHLTDKAGLSRSQLHYYKPIDADKIPEFASQFDIGLATETGFPYNREICLTNKIFTYMQAGIAILASDTMAQQQLLRQYPGAGLVYKKEKPKDIADKISTYLENSDSLFAAKEQSADYSTSPLNWEEESKIFLKLIESII